MDIHTRIKLVIKWLIGIGIADTQEAIGKILGYSNKSSFSQILNKKVPIPNNFIEKLCSLNPSLNKQWIAYEEGDMLITTTEQSDSNNKEPGTISSSDSIIYQMYKDQVNMVREKDAKIEELTTKMMRMAEEIGILKNQIIQYKTQKETIIESPRYINEPTPTSLKTPKNKT